MASPHTSASWLALEDASAMIAEATRVGVAPEALTLATCACACARVVLVHASACAPLRRALDLAEAWANGRGTKAALRRALTAAEAACDRRRYDESVSATADAAAASAAATPLELAAEHDAVRHASDAVALLAEVAVMGGDVRAANFPRWLTIDSARREALRHMAPLARSHVSWEVLVAAYARWVRRGR